MLTLNIRTMTPFRLVPMQYQVIAYTQALLPYYDQAGLLFLVVQTPSYKLPAPLEPTLRAQSARNQTLRPQAPSGQSVSTDSSSVM